MTEKFHTGPFAYTGNKRRLMPQLAPHLPAATTYIDLFAGSGTVGLNAPAQHVHFNDANADNIELLQYLADTPPETVERDVDALIATHGIPTDPQGLKTPQGNAAYLRLRDDYNNAPTVQKYYALVLHCFNNQPRKNAQGMFNMPNGLRTFHPKARQKLRDYHARAQQIAATFSARDFRDVTTDNGPGTVIYADPPYLGTDTAYQLRSAWTDTDERDLYAYLDDADKHGNRFIVSNVFAMKGTENTILKTWSQKYNVHHLTMSYNTASAKYKDRDDTADEVVVTNFDNAPALTLF